MGDGRDSGLQCLQLVLRFHQVAVGLGQINHRFGGASSGGTEMLRSAREPGLKVRAERPSRPLPTIAELNDGAFPNFGRAQTDDVLVPAPSVGRDAIIRDKPPDPSGKARSDGALSGTSESVGQELTCAARIARDRTDTLADDKTVPLASGMAATVEINTGSRRAIECLMSPILRYRHESLRER